jgi:serine protease Do/serine protease DegQ
MARSVLDQLIKFGSVRRGLLGVNISPVTPDIAQALGLPAASGALVMQVIEGSAAEKAGIKAGDVITSVNGAAVRSATELRNSIGLMRVGDRVNISLLRDGQSKSVTAVVADASGSTSAVAQPDAEPAAIHAGLQGAALADAPDASGVLVRSVEAASAAAGFGLRPNDVIISANRVRIASVKQLRDAAKGAASLVLSIRRGSTIILVPLR